MELVGHNSGSLTSIWYKSPIVEHLPEQHAANGDGGENRDDGDVDCNGGGGGNRIQSDSAFHITAHKHLKASFL